MDFDKDDIQDVYGYEVYSRASSVVGYGVYSMQRGKASLALPRSQSPFTDPLDRDGTGDCVALALWASGISRFNAAFLPDKTRWKKGVPLPAHCIYGEKTGPGWINTDSIEFPNILFHRLKPENVVPGDLVSYPSYISGGKKVPGHIGVVTRIVLTPKGQRVWAIHLNGRDGCVSWTPFRLPSAHKALSFHRGYNRTDLGTGIS